MAAAVRVLGGYVTAAVRVLGEYAGLVAGVAWRVLEDLWWHLSRECLAAFVGGAAGDPGGVC